MKRNYVKQRGADKVSKKILMVAGPNGAGKTTMTLELISDRTMVDEFINADEIAKGLAPLHPESKALEASKLMIRRLKELLEINKSFAFETTAAGTNYVKHLKEAKARGYEVNLTFLWLASPEEAVKRVAQRVKQGGHDIPEETVKRRYYLGLKNLLIHYLPIADIANIMNNSSEEAKRRLIASKNKNGYLNIIDTKIWQQMEKVADER
jgi:predicted ABC-type ATPase